jgi:peptidoglycan-associated lipoprotein
MINRELQHRRLPWRGFSVLALIVAAASWGCTSSSPQPKQANAVSLPSPGGNAEYKVTFPQPGPGEERLIHIELGPDTALACRELAPKFFFDEAKPKPEDALQIKGLAACLNRAGMASTELLLVGRADAAGSNDYNSALGLRRAKTVQKMLINEGIAPGRIRIVSDGDAGAVGGPGLAFSQGYDRRVDIMVSGEVHAP